MTQPRDAENVKDPAHKNRPEVLFQQNHCEVFRTDSAGADWQAPLLITGCARSGTSALARLLSTHDRFCIFNEYSLYWPPVLEESVWHRIEAMRNDNPPPNKIAADMPSLRSRFAADVPVPVCDRTIRDWIFRLAKSPVRVYGDKMPFSYLDNMEEA